MGVPDDAIEAYLAKDAQGFDTEVLEENWNAFRVYPACQWDIVPSGGGMAPMVPRFIGIRAAEVEAVARMFGIEATEDLLNRVRIIASEARGILNED